MIKNISILLVIGLTLLFVSCNNDKQPAGEAENGKKAKIYTVNEIMEDCEMLSGKIVTVTGIVDHICQHSGRRFKIVDKPGGKELKIQLGKAETSSDMPGKKVIVTGKISPEQMDAKMVNEWKEKMMESHKGEESTEHYKEELAFIESIAQKIASGKIPFYTRYLLKAEKYDFR